MRTLRDHIVCITGVLALAGASALGGEEKLSLTRTASCLVKIAVDPAVLPLNPATVESLIGSPAVAGQAARQALGLDPDAAAQIQESILIEWLLDDGRNAGPQAPGFSGEQDALSEDIMRQMEQIYGMEYAKMMQMQGTPDDKADSQPGGHNPPKPQSRRYNPRSNSPYGIAGGGPGPGGAYGRRGGPSPMEGVQQSVMIRLSVQLQEEVKPAAEEFLSAVVRNLRQNLQYAFEMYETDLQDVASRAESRRESAAAELGKLLGDAVDASMVLADTGDLMARRRELTKTVRDTEMDLASMNARRQAIEEQIALTQKELADKQRGDEITDSLARIVQTNQDLLANLQKQLQAGRVPETEVIKAQENVMKARIELARRREELARSAGGDQLGRFSKELSEIAIDAAENKARLEMLRQQLMQAQEQLDQVSRFDPKTAAVRAARQVLETAEIKAVELKRRLVDLDLNPPMVTVLGVN